MTESSEILIGHRDSAELFSHFFHALVHTFCGSDRQRSIPCHRLGPSGECGSCCCTGVIAQIERWQGITEILPEFGDIGTDFPDNIPPAFHDKFRPLPCKIGRAHV